MLLLVVAPLLVWVLVVKALEGVLVGMRPLIVVIGVGDDDALKTLGARQGMMLDDCEDGHYGGGGGDRCAREGVDTDGDDVADDYDGYEARMMLLWMMVRWGRQ